MAPRWRPASLDRRTALVLLGRAGAVLVAGCGTAPEPPGCALAPALTAGPYWRDASLRRSDLRWDGGGEPRPGIPLLLVIRVMASAEDRCRSVRGARVDVWHCDATGIYSDVPERGSGGREFLRGHQFTDATGQVGFLTIYPGWYPGRAVHVHTKVRTFDPFGETTTEVSTQLFFDDAVSDAVFATAPYVERGPRDTRNAADPIFPARRALVVAVAGDVRSGLSGSVDLAIRVGEIRRD